MSSSIDFEDLEELINRKDITNIQQIFENLTISFSKEIKKDPLRTDIKIAIDDSKDAYDDPFNFGIIKNSPKKKLIKISSNYKRFFPEILLREVIKTFVPTFQLELIQVQFLIGMIVELKLERISNINEWRKLIRGYEPYSDFFLIRTDTVIKFLKLEDPSTKENMLPTLFKILNQYDLKSVKIDILDLLVFVFMEKLKMFYQNEDLLETIRVLKEIFYHVLTYRALLDYKDYFKEFKENGIIKTHLSLRKFTSNVRWLNKHSFCAPTYQIDWNAIGLPISIIYLSYHPTFNWIDMKDAISNFPFLFMQHFSVNGFSKQFFSYLINPLEYMQDIENTINFLINNDYVVDLKFFILYDLSLYLNLNYFKIIASKGKMIHPNRKGFEKDFVLDFFMKYSKNKIGSDLSLLDFLILDRAKQLSFTGFAFERRESTLIDLKSDLLNDISHQTRIIENYKVIMNKFEINKKLKEKLYDLIESNYRFGFFGIKKIVEIIVRLNKLFVDILENNEEVKNIQDLLKNSEIFQKSASLQDKVDLKRSEIQKLLFYDLLQLYFQNKKMYNEERSILELILEFFDLCSKLKIFDLIAMKKIVSNPEISSKIYQDKEEKLDVIYKESKMREITSQEVESRLEDFSTGKDTIIYPNMIQSMISITFNLQIYNLIVKYDTQTTKFLQKFASLVPYLIYYTSIDKISKIKYYVCRFGVPFMTLKERFSFQSILYTILGEDIEIFERLYHPGFYGAFTRRDYYDFINKSFFYTPHLFNEYKTYIKSLLGNGNTPLKSTNSFLKLGFFNSQSNFHSFIDDLNLQRTLEPETFELSDLKDLEYLFKNLNKILLDNELFEKLKNKSYYETFVESIVFEPAYPSFGLQKSHLYLKPINLGDIDFKLLLSNTFLSLKFIPSSAKIGSIFIKSLNPDRNPNKSYINWLIFSKKNISEYCLFSIKKSYNYLNLSQNLNPDGWFFDYSKFKSHLINSLNNDNPITIESESFNTIDYEYVSPINIKGQDSAEYKDLTKIFHKKPKNLKKVWGVKKAAKLQPRITNLIKTKYIYPKLKLKGLKIRDQIRFIIPDLHQSQIDKIFRVFTFFNILQFNYIEGDYYIHSFEREKHFENGLFIKLYLPQIDLSEIFDLLFQSLKSLEINHVIVLSEVFSGEIFLKKIYKPISLDVQYFPLKNLQWNQTDKIWMNPKLFGEKFEPIYPSLI